ncbi:MAG: RNA polymerase sigma factor [Acidobacteria bacterium]|nr:RNA polymerase sigma factor [Acidobacteriota bacterium]
MKDQDDPEATGADARFAAALDAYSDLLRRAVSRYCPRDSRIQCADIEQEARVRLWRAFRDEREITDLASYIYRIAATATIDAVRRVKARREEHLGEEGECEENGPGLWVRPPKDPGQSPERQAEMGEVVRKVDEALALLPEESRRAVGLYLQGMTCHEAAELLGWTEPKARNIIYRARDAMRRTLSAWGIDYEVE